MRTILLSGLVMGLLAASTGCAPTPRVGTGISGTEQVFGDYGITGNGCNFTIAQGSKVTKLSIIGDNNTVNVQDGVTLYRVEFWGKGNTVIVPDTQFIYRVTEVGSNQIIRRPHQPLVGEELPAVAPAPATEPMPAMRTERRPAMRPAGEPMPPEADIVGEPSNTGDEEK